MSRKRIKGAVILELLQGGVITTTDLFINSSLEFFRHSYKGGSAPLRGIEFSIKDIFTDIKEEQRGHRRFCDLLRNLRRDGLIIKDSNSKSERWLISERGRNELVKIKLQPEKRYPKVDSKEVIVVSYDIPERYRADRDWFRSVLRLLDFKIMHQSVWIGKTMIPEILLRDLGEKKIDTFIQIFTVGKEGSLTQIL